jgi:hypothetical protein
MDEQDLKELGELVKQLSEVNELLKERRSWRIHVDRTREVLPGTVEKLKAFYKKLTKS